METPPVPVCDFCSSRLIKWRYQCSPFIAIDPLTLADPSQAVKVLQSSDEWWAACEICHDMIEADDKKGLLARAVSCLLLNHPRIVHEMDVERMMGMLHTGFWVQRIGPAVPLE
jgi:hypothetical protein